jgi:uncharacterized membrane protein YccC
VVRTGSLCRTFLPAEVNAVRAFLTIIAVAFFWIVTGWPDGGTALTSAVVTLTVVSSRGALTVLLSGDLSAGIAAIVKCAVVKYAVLPGTDTPFGFHVAVGLVPARVDALEVWDRQMLLPVAAYWRRCRTQGPLQTNG